MMQTGGTLLATAAADTNVQLVLGLLLFVVAGFVLAFVGLSISRLTSSRQPHPEKDAAYECGEPAVGESWVQFDLRFYTVALVFIVFDVEVALLWPWAAAFQKMGAAGAGSWAFWAFLVFFLLIAIPFLYEWKSGYLEWVRSSSAQKRESLLGGAKAERHFGAAE
ncbi:MAG TPA: NADH-quinone oxidoreductase subunit A [Phycisphaerae bacterium]|nr:NADH-quinone oxidoreductase subunit A [Phycisphaerae bacterium]HNU46615.1 NADH-quinone oxidoreductase subunit A [Phycisphaerae bacterium]